MGMQLGKWVLRSLNRLMVLILCGGFLILALDLRYEHTDVVRHLWEAWIPIAYSLAMFISCVVCLVSWERGGRVFLIGAFSLGLVVGLLGFWFHSRTHLPARLDYVVSAWGGKEKHRDIPPPLAPLAFCGLGLMGIAACVMPEKETTRR